MKTLFVSFFIPGEPVGKGRARSTMSGHHYTPAKTRNYEAFVKMFAIEAMGIRTPITDKPFDVSIIAYFGIPPSTPKKRRKLMVSGDIRPTKKSDADNIAKIICDSLNGIVWGDDSFVVSLHIDKIYSEHSGVVVYCSLITPTADGGCI